MSSVFAHYVLNHNSDIKISHGVAGKYRQVRIEVVGISGERIVIDCARVADLAIKEDKDG